MPKYILTGGKKGETNSRAYANGKRETPHHNIHLRSFILVRECRLREIYTTLQKTDCSTGLGFFSSSLSFAGF